MADALLAVRTALRDRYDVLTHLGTGGMAHVYLARDLRHGRDVALKVLRGELAAAVSADRFLREIEITARLSHPHIRPLLDSGRADGFLFYAMPFHRGETLSERMKRDERLGLDEALTVARDLADALAYAHGEGIVHRDVKPGNVFLESGHAVLSDFGIALAVRGVDTKRLTETDIVIGTAEYMSPEQCGGAHDVDGRSDIYSLGCVLYEMLTGQPPFTGRSRVAIVAKQIHGIPPPAGILRPDLPVEVDDVLRCCLAKTPGDRCAEAGNLRDSIDDALTAWRTGTSRGTALEIRGDRTGGRRRLVLAGVGALAVLAGLGWWATRAGAHPLDPDKVVVFPLANRGGGDPTAGADAAMMIGNALVHAEPLRAIDGWQRLSPAQRNDPAQLTLVDARSIALERGAAHFITGGITSGVDSLSVLLTLHDTRGDSVVHQSSHSGPKDRISADRIGIRAMVDLLPALLDPGRNVDLSFLTERKPSAIALWISGDREYRSARFGAALSFYREAVAEDSLLALAALKGALAASWAERPDEAEDLTRLAVANDSILPTRYRRFAEGIAAYREGRADDAVTELRAALELDPEWSEAWMALGEVYQHLLPSDLRAGVSAPEAFRRAAEYDPDFAPPLIHLSQYSIRSGESGFARELVHRLTDSRAEGAASLAAPSLELACAANGPGAVEWPVATTEDDALVILEAAAQLAVGATFPACAEAGFRMLLDAPGADRAIRWGATMGLQSLLVAGGRDREAQELLDRTVTAGTSAALFLPPLDVLAGAHLRAGAERVDSIARARWAPDFHKVAPLTLWLLATWNAHVGDRVTLDVLRTRLAEAQAEEPTPRTAMMLVATDARVALGQGDTTRAVDLLRSLRAVGTRTDLLTALAAAFPAERLLLSELLLARGEAEEAYWTAAALDHPQPLLFPAFVPRSLALRLRAASRLSGPRWRARVAEALARLEALGRTDVTAPHSQPPTTQEPS